MHVEGEGQREDDDLLLSEQEVRFFLGCPLEGILASLPSNGRLNAGCSQAGAGASPGKPKHRPPRVSDSEDDDPTPALRVRPT